MIEMHLVIEDGERPDEKFVGSDPNWSLEEWRDYIEQLREKFGPDAKLRTDAGYNNVEMVVKEKPTD